jgi:sec-independent protein translocase protein TatA
MPTPSLPEILIILAIVLVIFGPKRLPDLGRSLGKGMREFKDSVTGGDDDKDDSELPTNTATAAKAEPAEPRKAETPAETQS